MRKKISTTIYVTPEQSERLKLLHTRTKVPMAEYIREGIDLVLKKHAHLLPGQLPLVDSRVSLEKAVQEDEAARRGRTLERASDRNASAGASGNDRDDSEEKIVAKGR